MFDAPERVIRLPSGRGPRSNVEVELPTLHEDQVRAFMVPGRHKAVRAGRRWGKTLLAETVVCDAAIQGMPCAWMAPEYKFLSEAYNDVLDYLGPLVTRSSKMEGVIRLETGGRIDFWSLDNERAGRSRKYKLVVIDEAAFCKPNMTDIWRKSIEPTLLDLIGSALVTSNTNGTDPENFFYQICNDKKWGFTEYHAPTHANPFMPAVELEALKARTHPLVFEQEYLAEFVDFSGNAFFALPSLLVNDQPVSYPLICDGIFTTIDTAVKDKSEHDGTACIHWAYDKHGYNKVDHQLTILDYDIMHIQGSLLEAWLPTVYQRQEQLARECRARFGALGAWIEDKASGTILLQQAKRRGWPANPIDNDLVKLGKDARAISVSGYVHRGLVKISREAYDRQMLFREVHRNHLLGQVVGYRVGFEGAAGDDLLDCFTYGLSMALGNSKGF